MNKEQRKILDKVTEYLEKYPEIRFGQALFNLNINQFVPQQQGMFDPNRMRDIYNDSDKQILERIKS